MSTIMPAVVPEEFTGSPPKRQKKRRGGEIGPALLFILPATLGFLLFFLWPTIRGIYLSFTTYDGSLRPAKWIGLVNYKHMLHDPVLANSLLVTLEYVVINIVL